jgi:hypothetical protein
MNLSLSEPTAPTKPNPVTPPQKDKEEETQTSLLVKMKIRKYSLRLYWLFQPRLFFVMADMYQVLELKTILVTCITTALRRGSFLDEIKTLHLIYNYGIDEDAELVPEVFGAIHIGYRTASEKMIMEVNIWFGNGDINCRLLENYLSAAYKRFSFDP